MLVVLPKFPDVVSAVADDAAMLARVLHLMGDEREEHGVRVCVCVRACVSVRVCVWVVLCAVCLCCA